jgi:ABC-2 type transport system permease protein
VPVRQGVELMLGQRQAVHGAWDLPREETMARFFQSHPQWQHTAPLPAGFHWKWYYAFQQLGDESVAPQVAAYREALVARQRATEWLGFMLPGVGLQAVLHRAAGTDLLAQLAYQDAITAFHARLRSFYYPYLFDEVRFAPQDLTRLPQFEPPTTAPRVPAVPLLVLALLGALMWLLGARGQPRGGGAMDPRRAHDAALQDVNRRVSRPAAERQRRAALLRRWSATCVAAQPRSCRVRPPPAGRRSGGPDTAELGDAPR